MATAKKNGRPLFTATQQQRQLVMILRSNGVSNRLIAKNLGIAEMTMRKHFATELSDGFEEVRAGIGAAIVSAALGGNMFAAKYWLSTHGGPEWRVVESRLLGGDGSGMPISVNTESQVLVYLPDNGRDKKEPDAE